MSDLKKKAVVLVSGGMDSICALYEAEQSYEIVAAISFKYSSKHNRRELPFAAFHCKKLKVPHRIVPLTFFTSHFKSRLLKNGGNIPDGHYQEESMKQTVVPMRNGIMLTIGAGLAESWGAKFIIIAAHAGDHAIYPDCREAFMESMGDALSLGTYIGARLVRPFIKMTKSEIVTRGTELGVDFSKTWSCYKGSKLHCGKCGTCTERREAFILAKQDDPTEYRSVGPLPNKPTSIPVFSG